LSPETFVGTGPFTLKSWIHTDEIVVQKSANYWDSQSVLLNQIELVMVSVDTEMQLFEENKLDWAGSPLSTLPIDAVPYLKQTKKLKVNPLSGTYFLRVNTDDSNASNPLQSASFRKAIAYSIDRDAIANHVLQGGQIGARSLVPPEMGLIEDGYFSEELSATELLQEAFEDLKQSQSTLEPITLMFVAGDRNMSIAQAVQKQIETTLNIVVQLQAVEGKVFNQRIKQKKFQLATGSWIADFNDPINFLEVFKHKNGSTNNTNWENPKYIDLLNQSVICGDQDERKQILRKAEEILMDQMPIIPIYHFALNFMQKEGVEGIALSPIGQVDFRWAHIDEAKHSR
jgi:oligopeptide transport system substrate-binding protein